MGWGLVLMPGRPGKLASKLPARALPCPLAPNSQHPHAQPRCPSWPCMPTGRSRARSAQTPPSMSTCWRCQSGTRTWRQRGRKSGGNSANGQPELDCAAVQPSVCRSCCDSRHALGIRATLSLKPHSTHPPLDFVVDGARGQTAVRQPRRKLGGVVAACGSLESACHARNAAGNRVQLIARMLTRLQGFLQQPPTLRSATPPACRCACQSRWQ